MLKEAAPTPKLQRELLYDWRHFWARPQQLEPPGSWDFWLILSGRGWGKTRTGAEWVREKVDAGLARCVALVGATAGDTHNVMLDGPSGLLHVWPEEKAPDYRPNRRKIIFWNGAVGYFYTAETPNRLRGPQHDLAWGDEVAAWRYPEAIDMLLLGLRMGDKPRAIFTTTPKPTKVIKDLALDKRTFVTEGTTYDNLENLAPSFIAQIIHRYEGTQLGEQEIMGRIIEDVLGAEWKRPWLDAARVRKAPALLKKCLAIDPGGLTNAPDSDDTGMIVAGMAEIGEVQHGYVYGDYSGHYSIDEWPVVAVQTCLALGIEEIVAEANQGGLLVYNAIAKALQALNQQGAVRVTLKNARLSKRLRAKPVAMLTQQGRWHHVGTFSALEDEQCQWTEDLGRRWSPNRMDAAVLAADFLLAPETMQGAFSPVSLLREAAETRLLLRHRP